MGEDVERLKQRLPLLDYLRQQHWSGRPVGQGPEWVGLCPLHPESRPSFYVNARKHLFYCHGCGQGGDLIRFLQLSQRWSFRQCLAYLQPPPAAAHPAAVLEETAAFYQRQWPRYPEARHYLEQRGVQDPALIEELRIGYAPGGNLRQHLLAQGYSLELLQRVGVVNAQGRDTFYRRIVFPCRHQGRLVNLYGRSLDAPFPHRFLPGSKGGLFAWEAVRRFPSVVLVEGLFDLAALWQAGFRNTTCALGTHLTPTQFAQLSDPPPRRVYLAFDQDENQAGQQASRLLARALQQAGLPVAIVQLPPGQDPNRYFLGGASAADFTLCLKGAQPL